MKGARGDGLGVCGLDGRRGEELHRATCISGAPSDWSQGPRASGGPGLASTGESRGQLSIMTLNRQEESRLCLGLFREAGKEII